MSRISYSTKRKIRHGIVPIVVLVILLSALTVLVAARANLDDTMDSPGSSLPTGDPIAPPAETEGPAPATPTPVTTPDQTPEPTPTPVPTPTPTPALPEFEPASVDSTAPFNYISGTGIMVAGEIVESYENDSPPDFGLGEEYSALPGIVTFRGNNFRDTASYGVANIVNGSFSEIWNKPTGTLMGADGSNWGGNGWTGQPLIVQWPEQTKRHMNMYDWAKEKESLVEVIYASMDGYVYFLDLETGSATRDSLYLGYVFKGAGALDPRGYPILYLGAGINSSRGGAKVFVISLTDFSILYEFGQYDGFAFRAWHMFDSSPLVDEESDTLIYPGENGILYLVRLNSWYNTATGKLGMEPELVKWRYSADRGMWLGMEDSAVCWRGHLIMADNGGNLMCLNLKTLEPVWVQNVLDDTNCTPVLELEDGHPYVYISPSFHYGWRSYTTATVPIWKIDAVSGEIVWQTDYTCYTVQDLSGGVQGSPAPGKNNVSDLIYFPVARTPSVESGVLVALDKKTGEKVWEFRTGTYSWSSPVLVYDGNGDGYIFHCSSGGGVYLLDARSGELLHSMDLGCTLEASPVVYGNTAILGTRTRGIRAFKLS